MKLTVRADLVVKAEDVLINGMVEASKLQAIKEDSTVTHRALLEECQRCVRTFGLQVALAAYYSVRFKLEERYAKKELDREYVYTQSMVEYFEQWGKFDLVRMRGEKR
jgi:hypothetical protein